MRKVTFGGANSLDNYFARTDHAVDWLMWSDEAAAVMGDYWKTIDAVLMGRRTYEVALRQSGGKSKGKGRGKGKRKSASPGIRTYVFSRTLKDDDDGAVTIVSENAAEVVREMKSQKGKDICLMGGGNFAKTLFEAGLIDEIGFNIHPVLLGSGIPLFYGMDRQIDLELLESKAFKNGCVYVKYRVKHG